MIHSKKYFITSCLFLFVGGIVAASTVEIDWAELSRISALDGKEYTIARNSFVRSHKKLIDIDKAINIGWREGLLSLILNARIDEPEWFEDWDNTQMHRNHAGSYVWTSNIDTSTFVPKRLTKLIQAIIVFKMEIIWKSTEVSQESYRKYTNRFQYERIWPKHILDKFTRYCIEVDLPAAKPLLWRKIVKEAKNQRLLMVAYRNLMSDSSTVNRNLIRTKLISEGDHEIKSAIMTGLRLHSPGYTSDVLIDTFPYWKKYAGTKNEFVSFEGFRVISGQPLDSRGWKFLRDVICDPNELDQLRAIAISTIQKSGRKYDPRDISLFERLLKSSETVSIRKNAARKLANAPETISLPILQEVLNAEKDEFLKAELTNLIERINQTKKYRSVWQERIKQRQEKEKPNKNN